MVNFRYGRRGGVLTTGTKTAVPVDFAQAKTLFDKLLKEKTAKGYTPDVAGAAYQGTEYAGRKTDFIPQLLNPITFDQAMRLIQDDQWAAQEKMDGERRAVQAVESGVTGINRKGLSVPLPKSISDELQDIATISGAICVDGEIINDTLWVFDLHSHQGVSLRQRMGWLARMGHAAACLGDCRQIKVVPVAISTEEKQALWNQVKAAHGEGIVFKRVSAYATEGRPHSGGDWLKFKFTESASCCVIDVNSVSLQPTHL